MPTSSTSGHIVLQRTEHSFEGQAVLNPGSVTVDGITHMFYRAVQEGNHSSVGYCTLADGKVTYRSTEPILRPEFDWENHGIEDPRVSYIEGVYYMVYIAYDGLNARIAYATATELPYFTKQGVISPPMLYHEVAKLCKEREHHSVVSFFDRYFVPLYEEQPELKDILVYEKDALLFPRKINGKFALVHRIFPNVQVIYFDNFAQLKSIEFWAKNLYELEAHTILQPEYWFESRHIGAGAAPIETEAGWLFLYHAVEENEDGERTYHAAAALLALDDPTEVIGRLDYPLFSPGADFEKQGDVNNVVFPTTASVADDCLTIYYGAADSCIAQRTFSLSGVLKDLGYQVPNVEFVPELAFNF